MLKVIRLRLLNKIIQTLLTIKPKIQQLQIMAKPPSHYHLKV